MIDLVEIGTVPPARFDFLAVCFRMMRVRRKTFHGILLVNQRGRIGTEFRSGILTGPAGQSYRNHFTRFIADQHFVQPQAQLLRSNPDISAAEADNGILA